MKMKRRDQETKPKTLKYGYFIYLFVCLFVYLFVCLFSCVFIDHLLLIGR